MKKARIVSVPLLSLVASLALAGTGDSQGDNNQGHNDHGHAWGHDQRAVSAPEIDPGQAIGALVLLGGTLAIIRGYRAKKK
jgi:hypothetical protein